MALDYIKELGMDDSQTDDSTEVEVNDTVEKSTEDLSLEPEDNSSVAVDEVTEPNDGELGALKKQIEGMEKRIADKDDFINELREASKQKEVEKQQVDKEDEPEVDYWDDPEGAMNKVNEKLSQQDATIQQQQLFIQEVIYANTKEDYWKVVDPDGDGSYRAVKELAAADSEFAKQMNDSGGRGWNVAYDYLTTKTEAQSKSTEDAINAAVELRLKEMGVQSKEQKEVVPSINTGGKSTSSSAASEAPNDGFAEVFG